MGRGRRYSGYSKSAGQVAAERHIREAAELSKELGGTDEDVKSYFFGLSGRQLDQVLIDYERSYGEAAKSYAMQAFPHWKDGSRKMSGLVASRLFTFLPKHMPLHAKFSLVESLWNHSAPSSTITYYCGRKATTQSIAKVVEARFNDVLKTHTIPAHFEKRFEWLSQGDSQLKQQLLNHFRALEKRLLEDAMGQKLPILLKTVFGQGTQNLETQGAEVLTIGKHSVRLEFVRHAAELDVSQERPKDPFQFGDYWVLWLILAGIALMIITSD